LYLGRRRRDLNTNIINHKMYKLKKNKLYYKSDQITPSKFDVGMTSLFRRWYNVVFRSPTSRPKYNLDPTLIQRQVFAGMGIFKEKL